MAFGVMFHHFYDARHPRGQGAVSAEDLEALIDRLGADHILPADAWADRARRGTLEDGDLCFTFDDALLCQYDIAAPVLEARGLTAFWFVYSSVFEGNREPLELYRYFRTTEFEDVEAFYAEFFSVAARTAPEPFAQAVAAFDAKSYLSNFAFYTRNDRFFRYLRDEALGPSRYHEIMSRMMQAAAFDTHAAAQALWMTDAHLQQLSGEGHIVGLHSYTHPTRLSDLSREVQTDEYALNHAHLTKLLGDAPTTMSHPCNSYGPETLEILHELGVTLGFCSNMAPVADRSPLEFPREDHANLMREAAA